MKSGPSRVNAPLGDLCFQGPEGTFSKTKASGEEWHQGIHDRMGMQRMRREGVEGAPGLVPWRGKGRSGTGVFAWCLSEFVLGM